MKRKQHLAIIIILILGFALRMISAVSHSFSSDELSAITRLNYNSLTALLEFGVKTGDMHPAGVQLFMKLWSNLFGTSEFAMRFPFVVFGTAAIFVIYLIGKRYTHPIALFSSALWAVLLFPIIQSELARPYSPGLLFTLLSAYFIIKFVQDPLTKRQSVLTIIGLSLSVAACMYTHYFAFITVGFMGISSLFFIPKKSLKLYITSGLIAILLFLPHISITSYQVGIEGGIQWLSPPGSWWLFEFLYHAFNQSWIVITCISISMLIAALVFIKKRQYSFSKITLLLALWFFGVYFLGHLLSYILTPVLKFPVMVFSLPFLIIIISNKLSPILSTYKGIIPIFIVAITLLSTTIEKKLFKDVHFEVFKELNLHIRDWERGIGEKSYSLVMNISNPEYLNFYAKQTGKSYEFDLDVINYGDAPILDSVLQQTEKQFLIIGYSGRHTPVQFFNQCLSYFPYIIDGYQYNNSAIFLLSNTEKESNSNTLNILHSYTFTDNEDLWQYDTQAYDSQNKVYKADSNNIYAPQFILNADKALSNNKQFIRIELTADVDSLNQITVVAVPENENGAPVKNNYNKSIWLGLDIEKELIASNKASFAFSLPPMMPANGKVKIYIWNRNKRHFIIKNLTVDVIKNIWNN